MSTKIVMLEAENAELKKRWEAFGAWVKESKISCTGDDRFWDGYDDYHGDVKDKMKELEKAATK